MPANRTASKHDFYLEPLEDRQMLAGTISARLSGNTLTISGDADPNQVTVEIDDDRATITAEAGTAGSQVIDLPESQINVVVRLKGGDDELTINSSRLSPANMTIDMGNGNDYLGGSVGNLDQFSARTGSGNDEAYLEISTTDQGRASIVTGSGNDTILLAGKEFGSLFLNSGGGDDSIDLKYSEARNARLITGSGDDSSSILESDIGDLTMNTGGGDDSVLFQDSTVVGETNVRTGGGNDQFRTEETTRFEGAFQTVMGSGNDSINIGLSTSGSRTLFLATPVFNMGAGNDTLSFKDVDVGASNIIWSPTSKVARFVDELTIIGGGGSDQLFVSSFFVDGQSLNSTEIADSDGVNVRSLESILLD